MKIRRALPSDVVELRKLYYHTITTINVKDYNEEQIKAWASTAERTEGFLRRIDEQYFLVAEGEEKKIIGFASLDKTGLLDFFVCP